MIGEVLAYDDKNEGHKRQRTNSKSAITFARAGRTLSRCCLRRKANLAVWFSAKPVHQGLVLLSRGLSRRKEGDVESLKFCGLGVKTVPSLGSSCMIAFV